MLADSGPGDQLDLTQVTAHTFLKVDIRATNSACWTGVFADFTDVTLLYPLDAIGRNERYDPQCCPQRADITAVEARNKYCA